MTTLGATLYFGFFAAAAVWLFLSAERPIDNDRCDEHPEPAETGRVLVGSGRR
jgi:hypothetical protein